jgi:hypothetical protein
MTGAALAPAPTATSWQTEYVDAGHPGSGIGLGCSSNLSIVACSYFGATGSTDNLEIFDGSGTSLYRSNRSGQDPGMGPTAAYAAPIVFADGSVLAVDQDSIAYYFQRAGRWTSVSTPLPAGFGIPVSPVMVTDHIGFLASHCDNVSQPPSYFNAPAPCGVLTFGVTAAGVSILDRAYIFDARVNNRNGHGFFETLNVPTVDTAGPVKNAAGRAEPRVYVLASEICVGCANEATGNPGLLVRRQGRLQTVDVDPASGLMSACYGGRLPNTCLPATQTPPVDAIRVILDKDLFGRVHNEAIDFPGPSGSTPLLVKNAAGQAQIFFDGLNRSRSLGSGSCPLPGKPQMRHLNWSALMGCFYAVVDDGAALSPLWVRKFPAAQFQAAATLDPDGYFWVDPLVAGSGDTCSAGTKVIQGITPYRNCLVRVDPASGNVVQAIDLTGLLPGHSACTVGQPCWGPSSAYTVAESADGFKILTGALALNQVYTPAYFMAVDVPRKGAPSALSWQLPYLYNGYGAPLGQFPIVQYRSADGVTHTRTVFSSAQVLVPDVGAGPYFVGD